MAATGYGIMRKPMRFVGTAPSLAARMSPRERAPDDRLGDIRDFDPATDRNCFSTMFGYSGFHGDPA
jgi:hypothetical protein